MVSTKCPICDNPGIPDYHLQNVICPHCGSDLSIYKKINDAARLDNPKTSDHYFNAKKILIATLAFICIAAVASFISYNVSRKPLLEQIEKMNTEINSLNESLAQAKSKAQTKPETTNSYMKCKRMIVHGPSYANFSALHMTGNQSLKK